MSLFFQRYHSISHDGSRFHHWFGNGDAIAPPLRGGFGVDSASELMPARATSINRRNPGTAAPVAQRGRPCQQRAFFARLARGCTLIQAEGIAGGK